ncbi:MAG: Intracellular protease, PfpI family [Parcubacteria group bacterium GW2011_GWA2_47_7]|nr:MAG: Intracellular protease, PfpI family [Parcubacteria group bacterium GW2011_GWA2_47_7]
MTKILLLVANEGFQTLEYDNPKHTLTEAGHIVITASRDGGTAISTDNEKIETDLKLSDVITSDYDGVFVIGGPGSIEYLNNNETARIIGEAKSSPHVFCDKYGCVRELHPVVRDGRVITADGPSSASAFGEEIVKALAEEGN